MNEKKHTRVHLNCILHKLNDGGELVSERRGGEIVVEVMVVT